MEIELTKKLINQYDRIKYSTVKRRRMETAIDESFFIPLVQEMDYNLYEVGQIVTFTNAKYKELVGHRARIIEIIADGEFEIRFLTGHGLRNAGQYVEPERINVRRVVYQEISNKPYKILR